MNTEKSSNETVDQLCRINAQRVQNISLVWLDSSINENTLDCQNLVTQFRRAMNTTNTFADCKKCIEFLENMGNEKACMIISESLDQQVLHQIHDLVQVDTIFILCNNKSSRETWAKNWPKVKGIFTEMTSICEALKRTACQCEQDSISMSFVKPQDLSSKDKIEPSFMYTTILKEILLTIDFDEQHIKEYIEYCRNVFSGNDSQLQNITKFECERTQKSPVWWYTYDCFLYPMLNRGLRLLNADIIIKMGFFIADLHRQIDELHKEQFGIDQSKNSFIVYRGQGMSKIQFRKLQETKGGLLSFNNFLSTSKKREVSLVFIPNGTTDTDNVGILFVIAIGSDQSTTPFASIAHISHFGNAEEEVLFAMHSVFRINDIQPMCDYPGVFRVDLTLTNDTDKDLQMLTDRIREESFSNSTGWYRLASVLYKMGQFEKTKQVYEMLLEQETGMITKSFIYNQIGMTKYEQGEYQEAIKFYEKSLTIREQLLPDNHSDLAKCYNNMGLVYKNIGEYAKALSCYEKSLAIIQQSLPTNHPDLAASYNNIGLVYRNMREYNQALSNYEKSLAIREQIFPANHPELAKSYNNIGNVCAYTGDNVKALSYFERSLAIQQQSLPSNHPDLAVAYNNIGFAYKNMSEFIKALSYFEKSLEIRKLALSIGHPDLAFTYDNIGTIYEEMADYSKACSFVEKAVDVAQKMLPENHPDRKKYENNLDRIKNKM